MNGSDEPEEAVRPTKDDETLRLALEGADDDVEVDVGYLRSLDSAA